MASDSWSCSCRQLATARLRSCPAELVRVSRALSRTPVSSAHCSTRLLHSSDSEPSNGSFSLSARAKNSALRSSNDTSFAKSMYRRRHAS